MKKQNLFLMTAAIGIFPVAMSYGLLPGYFFGIDLNTPELVNIFRAIMGLYTAMGIFWLIGALKKTYTEAALYSVAVFMGGLSIARILSINIDGMPNAILLAYTAVEIAIGTTALWLINQNQQQINNAVLENA
ncbi:hypothetical protein VIN01S_35150 [Vibrio inusitatus NBRC 102082]|uniref:DUF4345 domain-containing protein n=1 Tax=Vibrio inusitatus NBRC 102082 TaxID=1219070 RepID=A0A4Y3I0A6_9VIBR|nr:DUF4345 domain-containing protein [Vibrio inusitatus]GEA52711.1 hypothetical protein VIN01S_35150 [Vibrio inusitatus NBRC 102082]